LEAVTIGGTRVKATGLRDRNTFSQRVVRQRLSIFGYNYPFLSSIFYAWCNMSKRPDNYHNFIFILPCIVIDFFLNNPQDALIIQIYSVIKLHVSNIFSAHHQEVSTVHSALVSFMQGFEDRFQVRMKIGREVVGLEGLMKSLLFNSDGIRRFMTQG
jgi:hypothetical protein